MSSSNTDQRFSTDDNAVDTGSKVQGRVQQQQLQSTIAELQRQLEEKEDECFALHASLATTAAETQQAVEQAAAKQEIAAQHDLRLAQQDATRAWSRAQALQKQLHSMHQQQQQQQSPSKIASDHRLSQGLPLPVPEASKPYVGMSQQSQEQKSETTIGGGAENVTDARHSFQNDDRALEVLGRQQQKEAPAGLQLIQHLIDVDHVYDPQRGCIDDDTAKNGLLSNKNDDVGGNGIDEDNHSHAASLLLFHFGNAVRRQQQRQHSGSDQFGPTRTVAATKKCDDAVDSEFQVITQVVEQLLIAYRCHRSSSTATATTNHNDSADGIVVHSAEHQAQRLALWQILYRTLTHASIATQRYVQSVIVAASCQRLAVTNENTTPDAPRNRPRRPRRVCSLRRTTTAADGTASSSLVSSRHEGFDDDKSEDNSDDSRSAVCRDYFSELIALARRVATDRTHDCDDAVGALKVLERIGGGSTGAYARDENHDPKEDDDNSSGDRWSEKFTARWIDNAKLWLATERQERPSAFTKNHYQHQRISPGQTLETSQQQLQEYQDMLASSRAGGADCENNRASSPIRKVSASWMSTGLHLIAAMACHGVDGRWEEGSNGYDFKTIRTLLAKVIPVVLDIIESYSDRRGNSCGDDTIYDSDGLAVACVDFLREVVSMAKHESNAAGNGNKEPSLRIITLLQTQHANTRSSPQSWNRSPSAVEVATSWLHQLTTRSAIKEQRLLHHPQRSGCDDCTRTALQHHLVRFVYEMMTECKSAAQEEDSETTVSFSSLVPNDWLLLSGSLTHFTVDRGISPPLNNYLNESTRELAKHVLDDLQADYNAFKKQQQATA